MNKTVEILEKMDSLLATEANWAKQKFGFDRESPNCGCLAGAFYFARPIGNILQQERAYNLMLKFTTQFSLSRFNDDPKTTFADVKWVIRAAINEAKSSYSLI